MAPDPALREDHFMPPTAPTAELTGWARKAFTGAGITHDCFEKGTGPGVVLLPEVPGITPEVLGLAEHLVGEGFTVVIPSLYGVAGQRETVGYAMQVMARLCVAAEFAAFATDARRPVADYVRALARDLAGRTPGRGVGVIGMCFSGGFALAAAVDDTVLAAVLSQPSVPLPLNAARRADPGLSGGELGRVAERTTAGGLCVLGLRFSEDRLAPGERFASLRRRLGDAFEVIELDSSRGNAAGFGRPAHSILTREVRETPGHATLAVRARVSEFLRERLELANE
jgi:dienelactone hydrolase